MPRLLIDNREIEVPPGSTILDAARKLGLEIPALCFVDGYRPCTSCMVCLVKLQNENRMVPSCATLAEQGMRVASETQEVHQVRKSALELLLSDHVGDCIAPCQSTCPAHMDIPLMLRQVAAGQLPEAIVTVKKDIALPAILGRVCPELCERSCRRRKLDGPASICLLKRHVADADLAQENSYLPPCKPDTGKKVAIIGAGPAGLSAAYHLRQAGHACTVFDQQAEPGGILRYKIDENTLPREVLDAEIAVIEKMGASLRMNTRIGSDMSLADLRKDYDAVLVAVGTIGQDDVEHFGLLATQKGFQIDLKTHQTNIPGIFAAGDAVHSSKLVVRSVADGKTVATCIDQYLSGIPVSSRVRPFTVHAGRLSKEEIEKLTVSTSDTGRVAITENSTASLSDEQARAEALRCLHCDCSRRDCCKLRKYAANYGARPRRYRGERKVLERHLNHAEVIYEPGKCILCGLCVQIASETGEPLGLTFINRGFSMRVDIPYDRSLADGLKLAAKQCAQACPTGALVLRSEACNRLDLCKSCIHENDRSTND
jgi:ferredoxin